MRSLILSRLYHSVILILTLLYRFWDFLPNWDFSQIFFLLTAHQKSHRMEAYSAPFLKSLKRQVRAAQSKPPRRIHLHNLSIESLNVSQAVVYKTDVVFIVHSHKFQCKRYFVLPGLHLHKLKIDTHVQVSGMSCVMQPLDSIVHGHETYKKYSQEDQRSDGHQNFENLVILEYGYIAYIYPGKGWQMATVQCSYQDRRYAIKLYFSKKLVLLQINPVLQAICYNWLPTPTLLLASMQACSCCIERIKIREWVG